MCRCRYRRGDPGPPKRTRVSRGAPGEPPGAPGLLLRGDWLQRCPSPAETPSMNAGNLKSVVVVLLVCAGVCAAAAIFGGIRGAGAASVLLLLAAYVADRQRRKAEAADFAESRVGSH